MSRHFSLLLPLVVMMISFATAPQAAPDPDRQRERGYAYLNALREAAGMPPLRRNANLEKAAQGHADYLARNNRTGHGQTRGRRGFTGGKPPARARRAGYPHSRVSENVTAGGRDAGEAVDDLMGAIYHRLGFLTFASDEVGFGLNLRRGRERYVFKMGLAALSRACADPPPEAVFHPPGHYAAPCGDKGIRLRAEWVRDLAGRLMERQPRVVLWPPPGARDIPPAFFQETPDPLPDYEVSGYPVSVQFNPRRVGQARVKSFRLYRLEGPAPGQAGAGGRMKEITATRRMSAARDPHRKLGQLEFALFPLRRLDWNRTYQAEAVFVVDGKQEVARWRFTTRDPGLPLYALRGEGEVLPVQPGRPYLLYYPGTRRAPLLEGLRYRAGRRAEARMDYLDGNTVRVAVEGKVCETVHFDFKGGRFALRLARADNTAGRNPPEELYADCPEYAADYRVQGDNEVLPVLPGRAYQLYFPPSRRRPHLPGYSYAASTRQVRVESGFGVEHTLTVKVTGPPCGQVDFRFRDGRAFALRLASRDNTAANHPPEVLYADCPEFSADYRIAGRNERLPMRPGRGYRIYFPPTRRYPELSGFSYRTTDARVRPHFQFAERHSLTVRVDGPLCGTVEVRFEDGRAFTIQLAEQDAAGREGELPRKAPGC